MIRGQVLQLMLVDLAILANAAEFFVPQQKCNTSWFYPNILAMQYPQSKSKIRVISWNSVSSCHSWWITQRKPRRTWKISSIKAFFCLRNQPFPFGVAPLFQAKPTAGSNASERPLVEVRMVCADFPSVFTLKQRTQPSANKLFFLGGKAI